MNNHRPALPEQNTSAYQEKITAPLLFLSSEESGWDSLLVRAYHEPTQLEGWITQAVPQVGLILLSHGQMLMEHLNTRGSWNGKALRQGDFMLRPPGGAANEVRWHSLSPEPMQTLHIHLDNELFARTTEEVAERDPARLTLYGRIGFQDPLLVQIGLALQRELQQPTTTGKMYAQTAAQMLAVHLLRHYTAPNLEIKEPQHTLTRRQLELVTDFVHAHLSQDLSLTELAAQIGFSPYHFARLFRRTTGESPHQFVLQQRLAYAQSLLSGTDQPLAQIALASGFANQSHLTQCFKRQFGLTPSAYRASYRIRAHF